MAVISSRGRSALFLREIDPRNLETAFDRGRSSPRPKGAELVAIDETAAAASTNRFQQRRECGQPGIAASGGAPAGGRGGYGKPVHRAQRSGEFVAVRPAAQANRAAREPKPLSRAVRRRSGAFGRRFSAAGRLRGFPQQQPPAPQRRSHRRAAPPALRPPRRPPWRSASFRAPKPSLVQAARPSTDGLRRLGVRPAGGTGVVAGELCRRRQRVETPKFRRGRASGASRPLGPPTT